MKLQLLILSLLTILITGCTDGEEGLKAQTEIQAREEIRAQNQNLDERAEKLASDLNKRRAFINAVEGEFEGKFLMGESAYMINLWITPSMPDYDFDRVRTLSELEYELQNSNLNIQVKQWIPNTRLPGISCFLENINPDLKKGIVNIISENCSNAYQLLLSEESDENNSDVDMRTMSQSIASLIKEGQVKIIQNFKGKFRPGNSSTTSYNFSLDRI